MLQRVVVTNMEAEHQRGGYQLGQPHWLDVALRFTVKMDYTIFLNGGWQDWSEFSENGLAFSSAAGGSLDATIDRKWDDTWYARIALLHVFDDERGFSFGLSYDSSPVKDKRRTFDLPVDAYYKVSAAYGMEGKGNLSYSLGSTLMLIDDAGITQTSQGVTASGEFDKNYILFLGASLKYVF